jgi:hypothetical protein
LARGEENARSRDCVKTGRVKNNERVGRVSGVSFSDTQLLSLFWRAHPFSRAEPRKLTSHFLLRDIEESDRDSGISERTNRWIKVDPLAVIGTLETLVSLSLSRYLSLVPLTFMLSLFLSNYYVREILRRAYY